MSQNKIKINLDSLKTRREWKRHKVADGHNTFRILPPFGESSNGYPYKKWQIIWGLLDPESGRSRPFASSMTTEKRCPVTEYVQTLKKRAENIKSQMLASGASDDSIKERLKPLNDLITNLNPKTIYIYNAVNRAGEVGLLELKSTAQKKMKAEMSAYIHDYNQDPTSLNSDDSDSGVWFDIVRQGQGRDTEYDVKRLTIKTKNAQGKLSFEDDRTALPDSVVENYDNLAYDLSSVYQLKSYDDLQEILDANMSSIIENCPDADLSSETSVVSRPAVSIKTSAATTTMAARSQSSQVNTGRGKINVRLDDDDDVEETEPLMKVSASAKNNLSFDDDDFLAEADALLNS